MRILKFLEESKKPDDLKERINFLKIYFLYYAIRYTGKGETKLKRYFIFKG